MSAAWVLMVFVSATTPSAVSGLAPHARVKLVASYAHKHDCLVAAKDFVVPSNLECPTGAMCPEPFETDDVAIAKVCTQGYASSN